MVLDFNKILQQQLGKEDGDRNFDKGPQKKENQWTTISRKSPVMYARVLPLGADRWFAKKTETIFVDYVNKDGIKKQIPALIDSDNPNDELAKLAHRVMHINYENRNETGDDKAKDIVTLNTNNSNGKYNFRFNIKYQASVVGVPIIKYQDGHWGMAQKADGTFYIKNYIIPWSSYKTLLGIMADDTQSLQNGQPFDSPQEKGCISFITVNETFPVGIKYNPDDKKYITTLRGQLQLPAIQYDYLQRDSEGNYTEFDDPYIFGKSLLEANPDFHATLVKQLTASVEKQLHPENVAPVHNPYDTPNVTASVEPNRVSQAVQKAQQGVRGYTQQPTQPTEQASVQKPQQAAQADPFADNAVPESETVNQDIPFTVGTPEAEPKSDAFDIDDVEGFLDSFK